ncbi:tyrosine-protein phosphatase [Streptacidiphilus sp. P02-A3a]|uniref:tyrosine-protein phosphatase n=1 Tax=Streptacidiphilus sp. P02-A3a TaxID=2704468 RepID=UPI0015FE3391|nr:tyrosine-protein phosphatase [Streptacidiphilus sp. P02-A3a]QMU67000.1 tyrosine-protein phosphatase [Streptacidiphilus sp. P02-A3a]
MSESQTIDDQTREPARSLGLHGAANARDLGGYRTVDGRTVRAGVALRGDALHRLTDDDLAVVADLGIRQVVDLRGLNEVQENGSDRLPGLTPAEIARVELSDGVTSIGSGPIRLVHLPVYSAEHDIYVDLRDVLAGQDPAAQHALLGDGGGERIMSEMYRWFVTDPVIRSRFAETVRLLADPDGTPLLFHCTAGKDRTGWAAAIVLTALGVDRDTVYRDYLLTNERSASTIERIMEMFTRRRVLEDPSLMIPVIRAEAGYLDAAFAAVAEGWADFDDFLAEGLGLDAGTLASLRRNLLTD